MKTINRTDLINARIEAVRLRDEQIINVIREQFPYINIAIATKDVPIVHEVIKHYLPEITEKLQIVSSDVDIKADKTNPDFYYNASSRLYIPTNNMALVDDQKVNIDGIELAGGIGAKFDPNDENQSLGNTVLETIEQSMKR